MKKMTAFLVLLFTTSTALAGAAFTETARCSEVGVDFAGQYVISVNNSIPDGYSHEIKLTKNGAATVIGSVNITDENFDQNAKMEKFYGKFPVEVSGKNGELTFEGDATINPLDSHPLNLRLGKLKIKGQKEQSLLCIVD
jgi:hypothetical protein